MDNRSEFVSTAEVVEATGKSVATVTRWVASGKLDPIHKGNGVRGAFLFRRADIEALLEEISA